tara:strand:- start:464 stop:748 length:285 start_codon:yes stop_codon:yes gene_type:complete
MNKTEIIRKLAKEQGKSKKEILILVDGFISAVKESLVNGDRVTLSGFGSFTLSERKGFEGVDPRTREPLTIPNRRIASFRCSKSFKGELNDGDK